MTAYPEAEAAGAPVILASEAAVQPAIWIAVILLAAAVILVLRILKQRKALKRDLELGLNGFIKQEPSEQEEEVWDAIAAHMARSAAVHGENADERIHRE